MSENIIVNERGAFGQSVQGYEREEITVIADAAIAVGTVVEILSTNYNTTTKEYQVTAAATAGTNHAILGVALEAAGAEGDRIRVCRRGICTVLCHADVAVDTQLAVTGTAGHVDDANNVTGNAGLLVKVVGQSLSANTGGNGGTVTAFINC